MLGGCAPTPWMVGEMSGEKIPYLGGEGYFQPQTASAGEKGPWKSLFHMISNHFQRNNMFGVPYLMFQDPL